MDGEDLRILLRIRGSDGIRQIASGLSESGMRGLLSAWRSVEAAIRSAAVSRTRWRPGLSDICRRSHVDALSSALVEAYGETEGRHDRDGYPQLRRIAGHLWSAEWEGVRVDLGAPGLSPAFISMLRPHVTDGLIYPQIDVIPRDATGRMGTRGGWNVMAWPHGSRQSLVARTGFRIVSADFVAMDVRSIMSLSEEFRLLVGGDVEDPYGEIASHIFGDRETGRVVVKSSLVPLAYGASNETLAESLGTDVRRVAVVRDRLHPWLRVLPSGADLARLVQTTSSLAFRSALEMLCPSDMYRVLFPVHDEVVMEVREDLHPGPIAMMLESGASGPTGVRYRTRIRAGRSYGELRPIPDP